MREIVISKGADENMSASEYGALIVSARTSGYEVVNHG